jgi:aromatic-L-amino-acid decarboxylase
MASDVAPDPDDGSGIPVPPRTPVPGVEGADVALRGFTPDAMAEGFRRWASAVAEVLARYHEGLDERPVGPSVPPGWLLERLPASPPSQVEDLDEVLADLERLVLPALVSWQSPAFHAYFPANTSWPAALADLMSSGLGQQGMLWATSPAVTELEMRMLDWVAELCGLPERFRHDRPGPGGGVIQDSASSATLVALLAARERAGGREELHRQVVYTSTQAHSSVVKGARIAGFREDHIRRLEVDDDTLALRVELLERSIAEDLRAGLLPTAVVATVGTTSTMAVDPVRELAEVANAVGAWVHVDAAMAGAATICPEHRGLLDGLVEVDSYLFNPHKWWGVTFDCTTMWVADRDPVVAALSISPAYLRNDASESGDVVDFRDWQVPLGRRFRSLKLWFVLRAIGADAIREMIRSQVAMAGRFADLVADSADWVLAAPPRLNLVCLRHCAGDEPTRSALERVNASGLALLTPTEVGGRAVIRVSVGSPGTTDTDLRRLWDLLTAPPPDPVP